MSNSLVVKCDRILLNRDRYLDLAEFLEFNGFSVLLPVPRSHHPQIRLVRLLESRDHQSLTLFIHDSFHREWFQDASGARYGFLAVADRYQKFDCDFYLEDDILEALKSEVQHTTKSNDNGILTTDNLIAALETFDYDTDKILSCCRNSQTRSHPQPTARIDFDSCIPHQTRLIFSPKQRTGDLDLDNLIGNSIVFAGLEEGVVGTSLVHFYLPTKTDQIFVCHPDEVRLDESHLVRGNPGVALYTKEQVEELVQKAIAAYREKEFTSSPLTDETLHEKHEESEEFERLRQAYSNLQLEFEQLQQELRDTRSLLDTVNQQKTLITQVGSPSPETLALLKAKDDLIEQLSQQVQEYYQLSIPLTDEQIFVGAPVRVLLSKEGYQGETGTVVERFQSGWWVQPDSGLENHSSSRPFCQAAQLAFNLTRMTRTATPKEVQKN